MNNEQKILAMLEQLVEQQSQTNQRLDSMETRMDRMETRMDHMETRMEARMDALETRIGTLEADVRFVKDTVIRIENDHGLKLGALFDGYALNYDKSGESEIRMVKVENAVEKLIFEVNYLKSALVR